MSDDILKAVVARRKLIVNGREHHEEELECGCVLDATRLQRGKLARRCKVHGNGLRHRKPPPASAFKALDELSQKVAASIQAGNALRRELKLDDPSGPSMGNEPASVSPNWRCASCGELDFVPHRRACGAMAQESPETAQIQAKGAKSAPRQPGASGRAIRPARGLQRGVTRANKLECRNHRES